MTAAPKSRANPRLNRPLAPAHAALPARKAEARIQLGARIAEAKYPPAQARRCVARRDGADPGRACDPEVFDEPPALAAQRLAGAVGEIDIAQAELAPNPRTSGLDPTPSFRMAGTKSAP
jgi:hypothetical protein